MTPEEFWLKMCTLQTKHDNPEGLHIAMDELRCKLLKELGYDTTRIEQSLASQEKKPAEVVEMPKSSDSNS